MWIPLVLLAATDVVLTKYIYAYHLYWDQLVTWAWYAAILWLGTNLREKAGFWRVVGAAVTSSVSFFLISNFAVWAAFRRKCIRRTFAGLMMSYTAGIPFFRGTARAICSSRWRCLERPCSARALRIVATNPATTPPPHNDAHVEDSRTRAVRPRRLSSRQLQAASSY